MTAAKKPSLDEFRALMEKTTKYLNDDASKREDYYTQRGGTKLEEDVFDALKECAKNTPFDGTIQLVSGKTFPDIIVGDIYGVEVKSTNKNQWKSIGSSILESTRKEGVEYIFIMFGKLGKPVAFMSRPYEECISDISVTHYPRYKIDMTLDPGKTIFDEMGISYDKLRNEENPVPYVSKYYKSQLKPGDTLWWAADGDDEEAAAPPVVRMWSNLTPEEKNNYTVQGYALFPEILGRSTTKYQNYALWLVKNFSIINTNIRDQFSAGGLVDIETKSGTYTQMPAAFGGINQNSQLIKDTILNADEKTLLEYWKVDKIEKDRIKQWCVCVMTHAAKCPKVSSNKIYEMLCDIFDIK